LTMTGMLRPFVGRKVSNKLSALALAFRFFIGNPIFILFLQSAKRIIPDNLDIESAVVEKRVLALATLFILQNSRFINRNTFTPFVLYMIWLFGGRQVLTILNFPFELGWRCLDLGFIWLDYYPPVRGGLLYLKSQSFFPWWLVEPFVPTLFDLTNKQSLMTECWLDLVQLLFSFQGVFKLISFVTIIFFARKFMLFSFLRRCWKERMKAVEEMEKMMSSRDEIIERAEKNPFYAKLHRDPKEFLQFDDGANHDSSNFHDSDVNIEGVDTSRRGRKTSVTNLLDYGKHTLSSLKQTMVGKLQRQISGRSRLEAEATSTHLNRSKMFRERLAELHGVPDEFEKILRQALVTIKRMGKGKTHKGEKENVFFQTAEQLSTFPISQLKNGLDVRFENEYGTGNGVTRSLFSIIGEELSTDALRNEKFSMFHILPDSTLMLKSNSRVGKFEYYCLGRLVGVALLLHEILPLPLSSAMLKIILDEEIRSEDVLALDPEYYHNRILLLLKPGGVDMMRAFLDMDNIPFAWMDSNGVIGEELCENGFHTYLCEENKFEYIHLLSEYYLCGYVRSEMQMFLSGLYEVVPKQLFKESHLDFVDLALLLGGVSSIDISDWKKHTVTQAETIEEKNIIEWFWEVVDDMDAEQKPRLLQFSTGCSRVPPGGFGNLSPLFTLKLDNDPSHLPTATTCFNTLRIPLCSSNEELRSKLNKICKYSTTFGEN